MKIIAYADVADRHLSLARHESTNGARYTVVLLNTTQRDLESAEIFSSYIYAAGTYLLILDKLCGRVA